MGVEVDLRQILSGCELQHVPLHFGGESEAARGLMREGLTRHGHEMPTEETHCLPYSTRAAKHDRHLLARAVGEKMRAEFFSHPRGNPDLVVHRFLRGSRS